MRVKCSTRFSIAKRFRAGQWSFLVPGSEEKWYSTHESKPQGEWDRVAELMMLKFGESTHLVFRSTSPLSGGVLKNKSGGKLSIHYCADLETIQTVFRTIISVNQLSLYGAVAEMWEECKSCHVRTGRLVLVGQSDPLFVPTSSLMKTTTLTTVDVGQYFMTKDTEEFSQFTESVACRWYTLPRDEETSEPKGWIRGNTRNRKDGFRETRKLDPCWKSRPVACMANMELRSLSEDNTHSWIK